MNGLKNLIFSSVQSVLIAGILLFGVIAGAWILSLEPPIAAVADEHGGHDDHSDHDDHDDHDDHSDEEEHTEHDDHDDHDHETEQASQSDSDDHSDHDYDDHDDHAGEDNHGDHDDHSDEEERAEHDDHDEHDHEGEQHVELNEEQIKNAGIVFEVARKETLNQTLSLNGMIVPNQEQLVHIVPRFPGLIRSIEKSVGESVQADEVLARIESNESLNQYDIRSPISGTVLAREAALGEFAGEEDRLMIVADLSTVWVDFRVYQRDFNKLHTGLRVDIELPNGEHLGTSTISYISPFGSSDTQTMLARGIASNESGKLRPGLFVTGKVHIKPINASVAVKETAIQYLEAEPVVFVREGEEIVARHIKPGQRDGVFVEVLSGLKVGEAYASVNSFMLKAELGKGSAAHVH